MVAIIPALSMWIVGLFAIGQVLKPRLPTYSFQIIKFPLLSWMNGKLKTRLGAGVRLRNDNYIPIDVHALSFDLYYPDYFKDGGTLTHIGHIQDRKQQQQQQQQQQQEASTTLKKVQKRQQDEKKKKKKKTSFVNTSWFDDSSKKEGEEELIDNHHTTTTSMFSSSSIINSIMTTISRVDTINDDDQSSSSSLPLWALSPRQSFETIDEVLMSPHGTVGVMSSLSWDLVSNGGTLNIPSSGVIQVKASHNLPLTLKILCDNVMDTWKMEMQGISCTLSSIEMGWNDMEQDVQTLRTYALSNLKSKSSKSKSKTEKTQNDTTTTTTTTTNNNSMLTLSSLDEHIKKLTGRLDWKKAMPMLAL